MDVTSGKPTLLNALKNANILNHEDLLLFQNHSLDNEYKIRGYGGRKKVTMLVLLIDLQNKYPLSSCIINNIIKEYIEKVPEVMYKINKNGISVIELCAIHSFINTIKILLNNGINVNHQHYKDKRPAIYYAILWSFNDDGLNIVKLLIEHDANTSIKNMGGRNALDLYDVFMHNKVNNIIHNIAILNAKN